MKGCLVRTTIVLSWLDVVVVCGLASLPTYDTHSTWHATWGGGAAMVGVARHGQSTAMARLLFWKFQWWPLCTSHIWLRCDYTDSLASPILDQWFYASCFVSFKHWNQAAAGRCPATATMAMTATATTWLRMLQAASMCSRMFKGASPLALGNPEFIGEFINIYIYIEIWVEKLDERDS